MKILLFLVFGLSCTCPPLKGPSFLFFLSRFGGFWFNTAPINRTYEQSERYRQTGYKDNCGTSIAGSFGCRMYLHVWFGTDFMPDALPDTNLPLTQAWNRHYQYTSFERPKADSVSPPGFEMRIFCTRYPQHHTAPQLWVRQDKNMYAMQLELFVHLTGALHIILHCLTLQIKATD